MLYIDVRTASHQWNISERRITTLCRTGRIPGAKKQGGIWLLPANAPKPADKRKNKTALPSSNGSPLPLPIGISDFKEMVTQYYYVDKTLFIKDLLDTRPKVSLFTRPRRFGKTLTMNMLKTFFEISDEDTWIYFKDMNIWTCGEEYRREQGQYPVIFLTFKDVKFRTWNEALANIYGILQTEFNRHSEIVESPRISQYDKDYYHRVLSGACTEVDLTRALAQLSHMLHVHYNKPAIIIIDEYDTPIQQGYMENYYNEIVMFMRNLFSGAFKDNSSLAFGFLTGILRVAKESIFSGLNNLKVNSILEERYSEYFGFTKNEILTMMRYYGRTDKYEEICDWYDGYLFGNTEIFNPWSVLNYLDENCFPKAFWQSTGDNSIIRQIAAEADTETADSLRRLMQGETISTYIDTSVIYPEIKNNPSTIYSFLLAAGYLKAAHKKNCHDGNAICQAAIPNKEISYVYEKEVISALSNVIPQSLAIAVQHAIVDQDIPALQEHLQKLLLTTISSFDYAHENFYHGLMLGLCAIMSNYYQIDSNKESGHGRYDIQLKPHAVQMPGIIIELKVVKEQIDEDQLDTQLDRSAHAALNQIDQKLYTTDMRRDGITHFLKIGIAFYKKSAKLAYQIES